MYIRVQPKTFSHIQIERDAAIALIQRVHYYIK